jgi:hypothetical protein
MTDLETKRRFEIHLFLTVTGEPKEKFFLKWDGRDSFFDDEVQAVLLERLPPDVFSVPWEALAYPIQAWSDADNFRLTRMEQSFEMGCIKDWLCHADSHWFVRLTSALDSHFRRRAEAFKKPTRALDRVLKWRYERYFRETSQMAQPKAEATITNARIQKIREAMKSHPKQFRGAMPAFVEVKLDEPRKYGEDDFERMLTEIDGGAARKAVHDENKRRTEIMEKWAACWVAHLRRWPVESPAQATAEVPKTKKSAKQKRKK